MIKRQNKIYDQVGTEHQEIAISLIIPTLNEEKKLPVLLDYIFEEANHSVVKEVIVVDGKSHDRSAEIAYEKGAKVVTVLKAGRAVQMNIGAQIAEGNLLYFLHSDTYPPPDFTRCLIRSVKEGFDAGCFRLGFDVNHPLLRFYSWFTKFDINAFRFGDQSLFVKAPLFQAIGGFDEDLAVMEDNDIVLRLREQASFTIMEEEVITSARRYLDNGLIRLQLIFTLIYTLHNLGVSQEVLTHLYQQWIR